MSSSRPFRSQNLSNVQPVQHQIHQMPYNDYYNHHLLSQANPNNLYSRPMATYGGLNNDANAANGAFPRRFLNPNAAVFEPRYTQQPQAPPQQPTYASAYSSYFQQPSIGAQQIRNIQQQIYAPAPQPITLQQSHSPIQHQQAQQQIILGHRFNDHTQMMYAQNGADYQQQQQQMAQADFSQFPISSELSESIQNSTNKMAIVEVQIGLEQLASEPQEYDLWATAIKARMGSGISKDDAHLIAWLLVEMSYQGGDNAQYSFARLCRLLDSEVKHFTTQFIVPRVAYFMGNGVESLTAEHLSNFIVFLAELYDKTEVNGVRISRLGQYVIEKINIQLNGDTINDKIVKSCVQVLKLVGRHIEDDLDPTLLNLVFEQLNKLQNCSSISSAVKNNIRQLNQLRERQWGVTKNEDFMNGSTNGGSYYQDGQNEVMYGPDGNPISEEEMLFLQESYRAVEASYPDIEAYDEDYDNFMQQTKETAMTVATRALERLSVDDDHVTSPTRKDMPV